MIHVFREKEFFLVLIRPSSWRVSQSPTRVLILLFMDHIIIIIDKWRLHAIFSDPRIWINRGSTMDQHGSTWISRLQHAAAVLTHASCVMAHVSCVMRHGSCVRRQTHGSCVMRPASDSWLMAHASCVRRQTHGSWLMAHASCVRRPFSTIQPPPVVGHDDNRNSGHFTICYPLQICAC